MTVAGAPEPARVAELFDAVADLTPVAANHVLEAACAGDPALREAVERLVAQDRAVEPAFLAPPAGLISEALRGARARVGGDDEPRVAERVGRFALVRRLGEGAMGVVYVGYDDVLDRRVAIKLLRPSVARDAWLVREGRALGRLAHPNVVAVYDAGHHEGHVYLAMEFIEGATLTAWLAERARPFREVLRVLLAVGRGLSAVHAAGLVHRDFKPDNVLVGNDGRPRIADFGLAALSEPDGASPPTDGVLGTPGFLAPERFAGERATPASDQWSFCVAVYRAVYGAPPFSLEGSFADLARRIRTDRPSVPAHGAEVPAWLGPILLRGLDKDPAARFPSMTALLAAIEAHVPRDPEMDRSVVRRELLLHRGGRFLVTAAFLIGILRTNLKKSITPTTLLLASVFFILVTSLLLTLRWSKISRNAYGRRTAQLFAGTLCAIFAHRIIAWLLRMPVEHILTEDLVVLATALGAAAVVIERWVGWLAAVSLGAAVVSALVPRLVWTAFIATNFVTMASLTADALRNR